MLVFQAKSEVQVITLIVHFTPVVLLRFRLKLKEGVKMLVEQELSLLLVTEDRVVHMTLKT
jgi:hypothetical protein